MNTTREPSISRATADTKQVLDALILDHPAGVQVDTVREKLEEQFCTPFNEDAVTRLVTYCGYHIDYADGEPHVNRPVLGYRYNDGGQADTGLPGRGTCVVRAIAIAEFAIFGSPPHDTPGECFRVIYDHFLQLSKQQRKNPRIKKVSHPGKGIYRKDCDEYLLARGWVWTPTMSIGSGCKVHLRYGEIPATCIARTSNHLVAVVDNVCHDDHDPRRNGNRCVYGYYTHTEGE